jgi:hypothetical protein
MPFTLALSRCLLDLSVSALVALVVPVHSTAVSGCLDLSALVVEFGLATLTVVAVAAAEALFVSAAVVVVAAVL